MAHKYHLDEPAVYAHLDRFMEYNHIEYVEINENTCKLKHAISPDSMNINGTVHGGLLFTMCDVAAGSLVRYREVSCTTSSLNMNFLKPVKGDVVYAQSEYIKKGRRLNVIHSWCYNEEGTVLCDASVTMCQIDE